MWSLTKYDSWFLKQNEYLPGDVAILFADKFA